MNLLAKILGFLTWLTAREKLPQQPGGPPAGDGVNIRTMLFSQDPLPHTPEPADHQKPAFFSWLFRRETLPRSTSPSNPTRR